MESRGDDTHDRDVLRSDGDGTELCDEIDMDFIQDDFSDVDFSFLLVMLDEVHVDGGQRMIRAAERIRHLLIANKEKKRRYRETRSA